MKNYKDYIGKTFKGFKFEDKKHSDLTYDSEMNNFIGEDLQITGYDGYDNSFLTDSTWCYPADLVIAQLEKQEPENEIFKPKRGDRVMVWDIDEENAVERIFLTEIKGAYSPYICVAGGCQKKFLNGEKFNVVYFNNMKPIPEKVIPKDTLVWCKQHEKFIWELRFYSHFENGKHYCFYDQKKSTQTGYINSWNIVTDINPF